MNFSKSTDPLFNVVESYNHALKISRISRGEPVDGIKRQVWEFRKWIGRNKIRITVGAGLTLGTLQGILLLRSRILKQKQALSIEENLRAA